MARVRGNSAGTAWRNHVTTGPEDQCCLCQFSVGPDCEFQTIQAAVDAAEAAIIAGAAGAKISVMAGDYPEVLTVTEGGIEIAAWASSNSGAIVNINPAVGPALTVTLGGASETFGLSGVTITPAAGHGIVLNGGGIPTFARLRNVTVSIGDSASDALRLEGDGFPAADCRDCAFTISPAAVGARAVHGLTVGVGSQVDLWNSTVTNTNQIAVESNNRVDFNYCLDCSGHVVITGNGADINYSRFLTGEFRPAAGVAGFVRGSVIGMANTGTNLTGWVVHPTLDSMIGGIADGTQWDTANMGVRAWGWGENVQLIAALVHAQGLDTVANRINGHYQANGNFGITGDNAIEDREQSYRVHLRAQTDAATNTRVLTLNGAVPDALAIPLTNRLLLEDVTSYTMRGRVVGRDDQGDYCVFDVEIAATQDVGAGTAVLNIGASVLVFESAVSFNVTVTLVAGAIHINVSGNDQPTVWSCNLLISEARMDLDLV